jgi:hypothetical protein
MFQNDGDIIKGPNRIPYIANIYHPLKITYLSYARYINFNSNSNTPRDFVIIDKVEKGRC